MKPILKWVGGKSQLLPVLRTRIPQEFGEYFEPFFGGGALFFDLERENSHIADFNPRLVNFYSVLASNVNELASEINVLGGDFEGHGPEGKLDHYLSSRAEFNEGKIEPIREAALFYYLNKTGFNGLFRENGKGAFNVPFGQKTEFPFPDLTNFTKASKLLATCTITHGSFEDSLKNPKSGDLVYIDPPYVPLEGSPSFTAYLSSGFGPAEQSLLAKIVRDLNDRGVFVIASNSYTPTVIELYEGFKIEPIKARRNINSNGAGRGQIDEALISNF